MEQTSRRRLLLSTGAALAALAGCVVRSAPTETPGGKSTAGPTSTPTQTPPDEPETSTGTPETSTETPTDTTDTTTAEPNLDGVAWQETIDGTVSETTAGTERAFVATEGGDVHTVGPAGNRERLTGVDGPVQQLEAIGEHVFVVYGSNDLFSNHVVRAVDAASGSTRWEFTPEQWWLTVLGTHDGTVYVATSDDAISPGGQTLFALAVADGSERWSGEVGDNSGGLVTPKTVYVPTYQRLYAYDHDGTERWTRELTDYGFRTLTVVGDLVAFAGTVDGGRQQSAFGLSTADGSTRWEVSGWYVTSLRTHDGRLFVGGKHVAEIDPASGETRWQFDDGGSIYDTPFVDDTLFTSGPSIEAVSLSDGSVRWSYEHDLHLAAPVAAIDDTLYVHGSNTRDDRNREVIALALADGSERYHATTDSSLDELLQVDDRMVAASTGGYVYGFE